MIHDIFNIFNVWLQQGVNKIIGSHLDLWHAWKNKA